MTILQRVLKETNCKDLPALKKKLMSKKKFEYGCYFSEIKGQAFSVTYTSNENCFASFLISFSGIGMASSYALDAESITKAGHKRSCGHLYMSERMWSKESNVKTTTE